MEPTTVHSVQLKFIVKQRLADHFIKTGLTKLRTLLEEIFMAHLKMNIT